MTNPVVIVVDDDEDFLHIVRRAIGREQIGADVQLLPSGEDALRILGLDSDRPSPPANLVAVFLDLDMPGVSGWEILRRLRQHDGTRDLPVVVISTSAWSNDVRRSYECGANSYLVKRVDPAGPGRYLAHAIRYWCELNRVPRWTPGNHT